jgi:hypothetical protein
MAAAQPKSGDRTAQVTPEAPDNLPRMHGTAWCQSPPAYFKKHGGWGTGPHFAYPA